MGSHDLKQGFFSTDKAEQMLSVFDSTITPRHVAIIMDGNGRWAKQQGKPRISGHKAGALAVREAIAASIELGVSFLTIYSFSAENWSRPKEEVSGLMSLFVEVLSREIVNLNKQNVRVIVIGDQGELPPKTRKAFEACVLSTSQNTGLTLVVALNYGSRQDIINATKDIANRVSEGSITVDDIDQALFSKALSTGPIPDPDLLIRTSGEMRISNFLLYEIAYTELFVTDVLWPSFDRDDYLEAVVAFQQRSRRFGGL